MSKEELSVHQKAAILDLLKRVDQRKNVIVFGQAIIEISKTFKLNPLVQVEGMLRELHSNTYLIALPMDHTVNQFLSKMAHSDTIYPFYLWTCVNGKSEADKMLKELGISHEENLKRLEVTGLLTVKPLSTMSDMMNTPFN